MNRQDRQGVRTPQDLEQKYDLKSIVATKKAVKNLEEGINKTNTTLEEFISSTLGNIENLQSQIDGNITTWFYNGAPTLSNIPAELWETEEDKKAHLGDLYFDENTGYAYRFSIVNEIYMWKKIEDTDVVEALAIANAAMDTADNKRRVFLATPYPPYDNGDLWFKQQEIYICQISKLGDEVFKENDFIIATKYTDDTIANKVGDELDIVKGTVTTIQANVNHIKVEIESAIYSVDERQNKTEEDVEKMAYDFTTESLSIKNSKSDLHTEISEDGMVVYESERKVLKANHEGVEARDLHATTYLTVGNYSRFENYGEGRTGCFWMGE